ncbi:MAG: hypothetical protein KF814_03845 [Nitrospiraceae bacterium]|nr:hypothetical protein [Nitrospiraceae bacterium]
MDHRGWIEGSAGPRFLACLRSAFILLILLGWGSALSAGDKLSGVLTLRDGLTSPNQPVRIEARLVQKGMLAETPLGGEPLQLEVDGKPVATAMTGGDGRAYFEYIPHLRGQNGMSVSVNASPRVEAAKAEGHVFVWERRRPILLVELAALMERSEGVVPAILSPGQPLPRPFPEAADELAKLTQYYYNVVYLIPGERAAAEFHSLEPVQRWLMDHKFPLGYLLSSAAGSAGVGAVIDRFKQEGWTTLKSGVGGTRAFAEAFLERRLEVVLVPEPAKGEAPRKAKVAKDWKDVRKRL